MANWWCWCLIVVKSLGTVGIILTVLYLFGKDSPSFNIKCYNEYKIMFLNMSYFVWSGNKYHNKWIISNELWYLDLLKISYVTYELIFICRAYNECTHTHTHTLSTTHTVYHIHMHTRAHTHTGTVAHKVLCLPIRTQNEGCCLYYIYLWTIMAKCC